MMKRFSWLLIALLALGLLAAQCNSTPAPTEPPPAQCVGPAAWE